MELGARRSAGVAPLVVAARASSPVAVVRIAVVAPPGSRTEETLHALRQLGAEVSLEIHHAIAPVFARLDASDLDLLVLDDALGDGWLDLLDARGAEGPPVVVVAARRDEPQAVEAFQRGASDCVARGPEFARLLAVAALEQIRRHRSARERGEARRQIAWLERLHEAVVEEIPAAVAVTDPAGKVVTVNAEFARLFGVAQGSCEARVLAELLPVELPERGELVEARIRRPGGETAAIALSSAPLVDAEGVPRGRVAILQDLTDLKQLQRQVTQSEKMASIGQLAAGVAHEINNPMGFVHANLFQLGEYLEELGRVWERIGPLRKAIAAGEFEVARALGSELDELVRETDADFLVDDASKAVRESLEGSERVRHIVQDLRAFAHQGHDTRVEADLNQCLDSTAHIVWTMMKHSVVLTKDYRELPPVRCFPMQLKQVFMNLLVNAYQAIEERDDCERGQIRLRTRPLADSVEIEIEDNGVGMPPHHVERIFEPFYTTKDVGTGRASGRPRRTTSCSGTVARSRFRASLGSAPAFDCGCLATARRAWSPRDGARRPLRGRRAEDPLGASTQPPPRGVRASLRGVSGRSCSDPRGAQGRRPADRPQDARHDRSRADPGRRRPASPDGSHPDHRLDRELDAAELERLDVRAVINKPWDDAELKGHIRELLRPFVATCLGAAGSSTRCRASGRPWLPPAGSGTARGSPRVVDAALAGIAELEDRKERGQPADLPTDRGCSDSSERRLSASSALSFMLSSRSATRSWIALSSISTFL